jgi:hypothetical protein
MRSGGCQPSRERQLSGKTSSSIFSEDCPGVDREPALQLGDGSSDETCARGRLHHRNDSSRDAVDSRSAARTSAVQQPGQRPPREFASPTPEQRRAQAAAFTAGGLRAAAAITGVYVTAQGPARGAEPVSLTELIDLSHVVLVGWVAEHSMALTKDWRSVVSEYSVNSESVLKGVERTDRTTRRVDVVMPGGRVSFPDGSLAQVETPGFSRPFNDRRYLFFLRVLDSDPSVVSIRTKDSAFGLTAGALSVFELTGNPRAKPAGAHTSQLARRLWKDNITAEGLTLRVRELIGR